MLRTVLQIQGVYCLVTGLWPLVNLRSFEWATGPKTDDWLVDMVGLLAAVIGAALFMGGRRTQPSDEVILLGLGTAFSFAAIDVIFSLSGRIGLIYLAESVVEAAFFVVVAFCWACRRA